MESKRVFSWLTSSVPEKNKKKTLDLDGNNINNQHLGVSKNRGTPKWMVYNGKPY